MAPMISVQNLLKTFQEVKAVQGVSFEVEPGECFGLLGPNGAGKSTLIKMLITLLKPDSGQATVNGSFLDRDPARIRESIGYVPQSLSVDGALTGRENLTLFGKLYGLSASDLKDRVPRILEWMDLSEAADRPVAHYSGGMVRRLEVGQAILHRPAVVFLDEPTVGLDPVARQALWDHIRNLQEEYGTTIFLTTHYMDEAQELCDRIAIMDRGKVVAIGTLAQLRKRARLPKADMDKLFVHFVGPMAQEQGDLADVKRARRTAQRLG
ncbi:MAG TPA: ATP-binding cassette domain-containing protein [bacterium]|nr:ATP-binding cassette domain-containing protein [bacterium]